MGRRPAASGGVKKQSRRHVKNRYLVLILRKDQLLKRDQLLKETPKSAAVRK